MTTTAALSLILALSAGASAVSAGTKGRKHTPEHAAAIRKCEEDYKGALKEARLKQGGERKAAERAARSTRKQCVAAAPM
jgi:hypothetical protein